MLNRLPSSTPVARSNPGMRAVYDLCARGLDALLPPGGRLLDLGVGSGRALSAILRRRPDITATAVDLAPNMLSTAQALFDTERLSDRVELVQADITALPERLSTADWDAVSCMWTLHQLPDFDVLRGALGQIASVRRRSGAAVWISDFHGYASRRPLPGCWCASIRTPRRCYAWKLIESEAAAFTIDELAQEFGAAGLPDLRSGHSTPLPYLQAHWSFGATGQTHCPEPPWQAYGPDRREVPLLHWGLFVTPC